MSELSDMQGKVALITGGGSGIGLACAQALVQRGAQVVLAGRRAEVLAQAAAQLGVAASFEVCDVADEASVQAAVAALMERHGRLDLAVNSAGREGGGSIGYTDAEAFAKVLQVNVVGLYASVRAEAQAMRAGGRGGAIVNISSIAAVLTHRAMSPYCTSKAAVNMLTRCLADDLGQEGIRVNAVMPGLVQTDIVSGLLQVPAAVEHYQSRMPLHRLGQPQDVAALVAFLLSDAAGWMTGQCVATDGGHTLRGGPDMTGFFPGMLA